MKFQSELSKNLSQTLTIKKNNGFKVIDLFAGCGGLSLGLEKAGFHPVFVNELNKNAMASYLMNRQIIEPNH